MVVTERYRYELTDVVTSDWDRFRALLEAEDELAGHEEGLALVRGPVLHGSFDGKKNSPFSWAVGTANDIEDEVTKVAVDLALACLDLDDPAGPLRPSPRACSVPRPTSGFARSTSGRSRPRWPEGSRPAARGRTGGHGHLPEGRDRARGGGPRARLGAVPPG